MGSMEWKKRDYVCLAFGSILMLPFLPKQLYHEYQRNKWHQKRMVEPPPICKRERVLTIPLPEKSWLETWTERARNGREFAQQTRSQRNSGLCSLPAEIRVMIYKEYIGRNEFQIEYKYGHTPYDQGRMAGVGQRPGSNKRLHRNPACINIDVLSLLLTCRIIYSEAISMLYSTPTYTFRSSFSFLRFSHFILPARFHALQNLILDFSSDSSDDLRLSPWGLGHKTPNFKSTFAFKFLHKREELLPYDTYYNAPIHALDCPERKSMDVWTVVCELLAEMTGLKTLQIIIRDDSRMDWGLKEKHILEALQIVRGLTDCRVMIMEGGPWKDNVSRYSLWKRQLEGGQEVWRSDQSEDESIVARHGWV